MSEPFPNAPDMGAEFQQTQQPKEPEELNFDPPEKVWDHHRVMQPTPSGTIDVTVTRELDHQARQAIHEAQTRPQDDFEQRMTERFNQERKQDHGPRR